jgi:hypothetical protein
MLRRFAVIFSVLLNLAWTRSTRVWFFLQFQSSGTNCQADASERVCLPPYRQCQERRGLDQQPCTVTTGASAARSADLLGRAERSSPKAAWRRAEGAGLDGKSEDRVTINVTAMRVVAACNVKVLSAFVRKDWSKSRTVAAGKGTWTSIPRFQTFGGIVHWEL